MKIVENIFNKFSETLILKYEGNYDKNTVTEFVKNNYLHELVGNTIIIMNNDKDKMVEISFI
jgi:hypothetical protein